MPVAPGDRCETNDESYVVVVQGESQKIERIVIRLRNRSRMIVAIDRSLAKTALAPAARKPVA